MYQELNHPDYWNNGIVCVRARECPDGFVPGRLLNKK